MNRKSLSITSFNYESELSKKHTVIELKEILHTLGLPRKGNKKELIERISNHYKCLDSRVRLQAFARTYLVKKFLHLKGPGLRKRSECVNNEDFLSGEEMKEISFKNFFSYRDGDGFVYGFDLSSFYNLLATTALNKEPLNPYNRQKISILVIQNMKSVLRMNQLFGYSVNLEFVAQEIPTTLKQQVEVRTIALFQNINYLGNYSDSNWFLTLTKNKLLKFSRELIDIWDYRASITTETKKLICPPHGLPFSYDFYHFCLNLPIETIQMIVLTCLERLTMRAIEAENRLLGCYYVLGALCMVNFEAAENLPWLAHSFLM
jgi:hypothetical protein